ncbi:unnamed protein product [Adineta ricciae]|uniref:Uncharacterized protein n=1 Tax=Adineta ricciae TaxID=249248 RepID=A0A815VHJ5_ADIRI|nr:unnamed protein product [Adineta ricciae]
MTNTIPIVLVFVSVFCVVVCDFLCNCYCPTINTYAGCGTVGAPTTVCNGTICAVACHNTFPACASNAWGQCRYTPCGNGNGLKISSTTSIIGFIMIIVHKYF